MNVWADFGASTLGQPQQTMFAQPGPVAVVDPYGADALKARVAQVTAESSPYANDGKTRAESFAKKAEAQAKDALEISKLPPTPASLQYQPRSTSKLLRRSTTTTLLSPESSVGRNLNQSMLSVTASPAQPVPLAKGTFLCSCSSFPRHVDTLWAVVVLVALPARSSLFSPGEVHRSEVFSGKYDGVTHTTPAPKRSPFGHTPLSSQLSRGMSAMSTQSRFDTSGITQQATEELLRAQGATEVTQRPAVEGRYCSLENVVAHFCQCYVFCSVFSGEDPCGGQGPRRFVQSAAVYRASDCRQSG